MRRFDGFEFSQALEVLWTVIARIDKTISDTKPWVLAKDEQQAETLNAVLYRAAETLRWLSVMLHPVMPTASTNIYRQLGLPDQLITVDPASLAWGGLEPGTAIGEMESVFPQIDKIKVMSEIKEEGTTAETAGERSDTADQKVGTSPNAVPIAETDDVPDGPQADQFITIDDFLKVE